MRILNLASAWLFIVVITSGCQPGKPEFALPDGDITKGQELFVSMNCIACHTVRNLELPAPANKGPVTVSLGGGVSKVKTYPELLTSIVNPSHRLVAYRRADEVSQNDQSLMPIYNDTMTVTQLVNLVAFLESRYEKLERPKIRYTNYTY